MSRFLDYGAEHAARIDLMENRVASARDRDPRVGLVGGDAAALPWPNELFDVVTQFTCSSSVLEPGLRRSIASEMWRVARPGGVILSLRHAITAGGFTDGPSHWFRSPA
jgi:ubiquinone/menaquinone biosynthesis C-methylase UbiE